jgi:transcriptional regulator with XRE-family HTH domain
MVTLETMNFSKWLNQELTKRNWTHQNLSQHALLAGYKISRVQITNILNMRRNAGPEACIAIAYALNIPREEVFRARGWLLRRPEEVVPPSASPGAAQVIRELTALPLEEQEAVSEALAGMLRATSRSKDLGRAEGRTEAQQIPLRKSLDEIQEELETKFRQLLPDAYEQILKSVAAEEAAALLSSEDVAA